MRRETQNVLLVLVGGTLIKIVLDGSYLRYVRPWSASALLVAGIVIVLLAAAAIIRDVRGRAPAHDHRASSAWLLLVPVLTILLVAPPALGSGAVGGVGARPAAATAAAATSPLPPGDAPPLDVVDFVSRAVSAPTGPLTGRDVTLVGFVVPSVGAAAAGGQDLARLVISCCAADASAVRVHLADPGGLTRAPAGPGDQWWRVRVRLVAGTGTAADAHVPTARVVDAVSVAAPSPVYES